MKQYWPKIRRMLKELLSLPFAADARTCLYFYAAIAASIPQIIRSKNLSVPHSKMRDRTCVFKFQGKNITLDGASFGYAGEVYARKCYTSIFPVEENDVVVDLGAAVGVFSIAAALFGKQVIAVDVDPGFLERLKVQAKMNGCLDKIEPVLAAVGSGTGMCLDQMEKVPAADLGRLLEARGIAIVDFLKIDIEGSEFALLRSGNEWLGNVRKIAMEVHPQCGDPGELKAILEAKGFACVFKNLDGRTVEKISEDAGYLFAKMVH